MPNMTLAEARDLAGLTQSELARRVGVSRSTIYELESGRNGRPAWELVSRIVAALRDAGLKGIAPEQLFPVEQVTEKSA